MRDGSRTVSLHYARAKFLTGAHRVSQAPPDDGAEVAFAGRSNAGKSSAINALTGNRGLARTSKAPGRTRQLNFFRLDETRRLVDLPGYGYARVSEVVRHHWRQTLGRYLASRQSLRGVMLMMDVRHPLQESDLNLLVWCLESQLPVHILLTKADKLSRARGQESLRQVRERLRPHQQVTAQLFSALKTVGVEEARACLDRWLGL